VQGAETRAYLRDPGLVVREPLVRADGAHGEIEVRLGNVNADEGRGRHRLLLPA